MSKPFVAVLITYIAKPDQIDTSIYELGKLINTVVAMEPDCYLIRMFQDPADPSRILLYEEWSSKEAYLGPHFQTPHLKAFIARAQTLFTKPADIVFWSLQQEAIPGIAG